MAFSAVYVHQLIPVNKEYQFSTISFTWQKVSSPVLTFLDTKIHGCTFRSIFNWGRML